MRRLWRFALLYAVLLLLAAAPVAEAHNDGRGFYGATNDKAIVNIFFGVIAFFPVFILFMTLGQKALEKRKEARKAAAKQLHTAPWRGGW
jgi:hypothetical protein